MAYPKNPVREKLRQALQHDSVAVAVRAVRTAKLPRKVVRAEIRQLLVSDVIDAARADVLIAALPPERRKGPPSSDTLTASPALRVSVCVHSLQAKSGDKVKVRRSHRQIVLTLANSGGND